MLYRLDHLPAGFTDVPAQHLHRVLPGPSLVRLPGEAGAPLFVTVLQHGNEHAGLHAVQRLLADRGDAPLPRPMWLFIGNPEAARVGRRRLDERPDLNRCWPGTELPESAETRMLREVLAILRTDPPFASVDIHNTTGESPHYAGINVLAGRCLDLARRFARTVVYFTRPKGAQSQAMLALCPSVTLECGQVDDGSGAAHAEAYLREVLALERLDETMPPAGSIDLFASVALVQVAPALRVGVGGDPDADLLLPADVDRFNFRELLAGTVLGSVRTGHWPVRALDPAGNDVTGTYFDVIAGELRLRRTVMPSLLSRDPRIIRQDCLCHLMERMRLPAEAA